MKFEVADTAERVVEIATEIDLLEVATSAVTETFEARPFDPFAAPPPPPGNFGRPGGFFALQFGG